MFWGTVKFETFAEVHVWICFMKFFQVAMDKPLQDLPTEYFYWSTQATCTLKGNKKHDWSFQTLASPRPSSQTTSWQTLYMLTTSQTNPSFLKEWWHRQVTQFNLISAGYISSRRLRKQNPVHRDRKITSNNFPRWFPQRLPPPDVKNPWW